MRSDLDHFRGPLLLMQIYFHLDLINNYNFPSFLFHGIDREWKNALIYSDLVFQLICLLSILGSLISLSADFAVNGLFLTGHII